jgi:hypothetical protein
VAGVHGIRYDIPPGCRSRPGGYRTTCGSRVSRRRADRVTGPGFPARPAALAPAAARAAGAGLLFGAAWLTKDEAALLILIPLLAAAALGWGPRRSLNLIAAGVTTATYAVYVAVVAANGEFSTWWESKTTGARRLLGLVQITGFNHRAHRRSPPASARRPLSSGRPMPS